MPIRKTNRCVMDYLIQLAILLSVIIFTKNNTSVGATLLQTIAIGYTIIRIVTHKFCGYELLFFLIAGLMIGTNYLLYAGVILVFMYGIMNLKKLRYARIDYELIGFFVMFIVGIVGSVLNAIDQENANLYIQTYFLLLLLLLGVRLFQRGMIIEEVFATRFFSWFSLLLGIGFFLTHSVSELFSTAHIFVYYISNYGIYSNTLAGMIAPFAVGCIIIAIESKDFFSRIVSVAASIMLFLIILVIQSRGTYLGIMIALLWICSKKKKSKIIIGALIIGIIAVFLISVDPSIISRFFGRFSVSHFQNGDFSNGRSEAFAIAWNMFKKHPIVGCGFWQFGANGIEYQDPHNYIFSYLASTGIIGTLGFSVYLIAGFNRLNSNYNCANERGCSKLLIEVMMGAFLITIGHGLVEPTLSTSAPLSVFIVLTQLPIRTKKVGE